MPQPDFGGPQRLQRYAAQRLFFPAAAVYAALAAPLSVHGMVTGAPVVPGFASATHHAHELLFGFALAVVTGFLVNNAARFTLGMLAALWSAARLAFLLSPESILSAALNAGFAIYLAATVAPPFMKSAKKWRNQAIGPILIAAGGAVMIFHIAGGVGSATLAHLALREGVLALALLMLFMGGRTIAPAAAGHIRVKGGHLEARVQPRLEAALLILVAVAAIAMPWTQLSTAAGVSLIAAAAVAWTRLVRWRLWRCLDRDDLTCMGIGYGWLVIGLALMGCTLAIGLPGARTAIHAITVGALGTLTITVMTRQTMLRVKRNPARLPAVVLAAALIAAAAVLRIGWPGSPTLLMTASLLWSAAFVIALVTLIGVRQTQISS